MKYVTPTLKPFKDTYQTMDLELIKVMITCINNDNNNNDDDDNNNDDNNNNDNSILLSS